MITFYIGVVNHYSHMVFTLKLAANAPETWDGWNTCYDRFLLGRLGLFSGSV